MFKNKGTVAIVFVLITHTQSFVNEVIKYQVNAISKFIIVTVKQSNWPSKDCVVKTASIRGKGVTFYYSKLK